MSLLRSVASGFRDLFRKEQVQQELDEELRTYLEMAVNEKMKSGMNREEALRAARIEMGSLEAVKEEARDASWESVVETLWQDLRYGARVLRKSPGFTLAAVLSLALGIGANTAVFSVVHAVLLRPLPYPEPDQLVLVAQQVTHGAVSIPEYEFWKEHSSVFASTAGHRGGGDRSIVSGTGHEWIKVMTVTVDFFRTLGFTPALGREFNSEETRAGGPQAIVLGDSLWRRAFGASPEVRGRSVTLGDAGYTVVGEVALSATLLVAAGLLIQSLYRLHQERLGFAPQGLITFETPLPSERHRSGADLWSFESTLLERLQALPGIRSVAAINILPLAGFSNLPTQLESHPQQSIGGMEVRLVTPAYFEAMGIPVLHGRWVRCRHAVT